MRKIREVLRLRLGQGLPQRAVAQSLRLSQGAVHGYMARTRRAGLGWPLPEGLDDAELEAVLFPHRPRWRRNNGRYRIGQWCTAN
jgi:hypothetical protein